jgi:hypothetical protein
MHQSTNKHGGNHIITKMPSPDNICSSSEVETDKAKPIRFIGGH